MPDIHFLQEVGSFNGSFILFLSVFFVSIFVFFKSNVIFSVTHPFDTLVHESSHALAAAVLGGKVTGIKIYFRGGGATHWMPNSSLALWLVALVGYPAGAWLGSSLAFVSGYFDMPRVMLAVIAPVALILALMSRTLFAIVTWLAVLGLGYAGIMLLEPTQLQVVLTVVGALMCAGSCVHIMRLASWYYPRRGRADGTQDWEILPVHPMVGMTMLLGLTLFPPVVVMLFLLSQYIS